MTQRSPAPGQREICVDRGNQFRLLRRVKTGSSSAKAMLLALDTHIGRGSSWTMTHAELADEIEVSEPSAYRISKALEDAGIIRRVSAGGKRVQFSICWGRLWEQFGESTGDASSETVITGENGIIAHENSILTSDNPIIAHENAPLYRTSKEQPSPSPEADERMAVMMTIKDAGVGKFAEAVESATVQGMTLLQVAAVVEHFRGYPGRWNPGTLFERLTRPGASLLRADEGWYGDSPAWKAAQAKPAPPPAFAAPLVADLESRHGASLDAMTDAELAALAGDWTPRQRRDLETFGKHDRDIRPRLLSAVARRSLTPAPGSRVLPEPVPR